MEEVIVDYRPKTKAIIEAIEKEFALSYTQQKLIAMTVEAFPNSLFEIADTVKTFLNADYFTVRKLLLHI